MLRHIPRLSFYPKQVIVLGPSPLLTRELETRTERVYHEVNGNPGVLTLGGRQHIEQNDIKDTDEFLEKLKILND